MKMLGLLHGFGIIPLLVDLCHLIILYTFRAQINKYSKQWKNRKKNIIGDLIKVCMTDRQGGWLLITILK